jgi:hypothetical protein
MTKIIYITGVLLLAVLQAQSQVGIQTEAPQALLHVDAASNNNDAAPETDVQKQDDFVVSDRAFTGVGDPAPDQKLVINGKLRIADGTQSEGSLLVSDHSGRAQWRGNVSMKGKYGKWRLVGTGISDVTIDILEPGSSTYSPATLLVGNSLVDAINTVGLTSITNGVHVPYGKYYIVLNGDVSASREFCNLFLFKNGEFWTRISYPEYLAGVTLLLVVDNRDGVYITLGFSDRELGDAKTYFEKLQGTNREWWYEIDFHLMGSTIF